jgi:hypothetical protein
MRHAIDLDHTYAHQPPGTAEQIDLPGTQPSRLPVVGVIRNHDIAPRESSSYINLSMPCGVKSAMHRLARTKKGLGRNACPVGAFTSNKLALYDGNA